MDETFIIQSITDTFDGINIDSAAGATFFSNDPERKFPFATIVTKDNDFDSASNLNRPSVFRLNIGISKATYRALFGAQTSAADAAGATETNYDFTALDQLMPHPMYGRMYWVCVLNPSAATFDALQPLLAEAYELSARRHA